MVREKASLCREKKKEKAVVLTAVCCTGDINLLNSRAYGRYRNLPGTWYRRTWYIFRYFYEQIRSYFAMPPPPTTAAATTTTITTTTY